MTAVRGGKLCPPAAGSAESTRRWVRARGPKAAPPRRVGKPSRAALQTPAALPGHRTVAPGSDREPAAPALQGRIRESLVKRRAEGSNGMCLDGRGAKERK